MGRRRKGGPGDGKCRQETGESAGEETAWLGVRDVCFWRTTSSSHQARTSGNIAIGERRLSTDVQSKRLLLPRTGSVIHSAWRVIIAQQGP